MLYLSQLLGAPVEDLHGARIGKIIDAFVTQDSPAQGESASVAAFSLEGEQELPWYVPAVDISWQNEQLHLRLPVDQLLPQTSQLTASVVSLAHEVLDKQVIDVERKKAVRVNDIALSDNWHILGVDNSTPGLIRRLAPNWLFGAKHRQTPENLIPWSHIRLISSQQFEEQSATHLSAEPALPRPQSGSLAELHPADIAEIVHQLTPGQGARIIEGLDDETAADTMEEIDTERQRHILENIQADRAADILEAMGPDEAADLLARLPEERAQELLGLMTPDESEDVQDLLEYEENTAGGLMTTDYITINQTSTVAEALEAVRLNIREHDIHACYVYCVEDETQDECQLLGVVSLWELLVAPPTQVLSEIMETDIISVEPDADPREVAQVMAKYNLFSVPVVTAEGTLTGIVTVDDALDILLPADKRRKPNRMY